MTNAMICANCMRFYGTFREVMEHFKTCKDPIEKAVDDAWERSTP